MEQKSKIKILQWILLVPLILLIVLLIFVDKKGFRFSSFGAVAIWMLLFISLFAILIFTMRGNVQKIMILSAGLLCIFIFVLFKDSMPSKGESVTIHHLKNDDRVAVTYFLTGLASIKATRFLAESFCFDLFYKRAGKEYRMDPDIGDPNLVNYDLSKKYSKDDLYFLFIAEEDSLLVDVKRGICTNIKLNKTQKTAAAVNLKSKRIQAEKDSLSLELMGLH